MLPEREPCERIDRELKAAAWRLEQYWSWSEAGTHRDAATDFHAKEYRRRLEAAATETATQANQCDGTSDGQRILVAISKRICGLYNAPVPTFPEECNDSRINLEIRIGAEADRDPEE